MKRKLSAAVFLAVVTVLGFAASAGAVDGTIEINQAVVMAAGGFPYKITQSGSYRLTGPLTVGGNGDAIDVSAYHVAIDLNGFTITAGSSPSSSGNGINANVAELRVENGTITNFGGGTGVIAGAQAIIRNVQADANGYGISTGNNSVIQGCTAVANSPGTGIATGSYSTISGNTANSNSVYGIYCFSNACQISGNTADSNGNYGIACGSSGCVVSGNAIYSNTSFGIIAGDATTGYGGNVLDGNNSGGAQVAGGTSLGAGNTNLCGTTRC